jgi:hypothetical protein
MEDRDCQVGQPRHLRRGRRRELVALLAAGTLLVGCTTTHALGRIDDPSVRAQVDAIAANGDAIAHMRHPPGTRAPQFGERVTGVIPQGLIIEPTRGQQLPLPREQVTSLSRYHHGRGARDGAIGGGIGGFVLGLTFGIVATVGRPGCSDDCPPGPDPGVVGLTAGAIFGVLGALFGAAIGAAGGHEDRFEITR